MITVMVSSTAIWGSYLTSGALLHHEILYMTLFSILNLLSISSLYPSPSRIHSTRNFPPSWTSTNKRSPLLNPSSLPASSLHNRHFVSSHLLESWSITDLLPQHAIPTIQYPRSPTGITPVLRVHHHHLKPLSSLVSSSSREPPLQPHHKARQWSWRPSCRYQGSFFPVRKGRWEWWSFGY